MKKKVIDPVKIIPEEIQFRWLGIEDEKSEELSIFFELNTDEKYISHGEVIDGRAISLIEWKNNLNEVMRREFRDILSGSSMKNIYSQICICTQDHKTIGLAIVEFKNDTKVAILEDIIIEKQLRKKKLGSLLLNWLEKEIISKGMSFIFMESGIRNKKTHDFFHKNGYRQSSIIMVKKL